MASPTLDQSKPHFRLPGNQNEAPRGILSGRSAPQRSLDPGQTHGGVAYRRRRNVTKEFVTMFLLGALIGFMTLVASTPSRKAGLTIKKPTPGAVNPAARWPVLPKCRVDSADDCTSPHPDEGTVRLQQVIGNSNIQG